MGRLNKILCLHLKKKSRGEHSGRNKYKNDNETNTLSQIQQKLIFTNTLAETNN